MKPDAPFKELIPGVLGFEEYIENRLRYDEQEQCIKLEGRFWKGDAVYQFPQMWLDRAQRVADDLDPNRRGKYMGIDPAEGGDSSSWAIGDDLGLLLLMSHKTPNTTDIYDITIDYMATFQVEPRNVIFDRGGGGKQHADYLKRDGYKVRSVGFGESATDPEVYRRTRGIGERKEDKELAYTYANRRAEIYDRARIAIRPVAHDVQPYGIDFKMNEHTIELRRQMGMIPREFDSEGRLKLPSKNKRSKNSTEITLTEILGCSPDETDAFCLMQFARERQRIRAKAGAI